MPVYVEPDRQRGGEVGSRLRHGIKDKPKEPSLLEVAKTAAEDLLALIAAQIKLARLEVSEDFRDVLRRVARLALFVPLVVVGYVFGMTAVASWLSEYLGWTLALASIAGLQILVGGVGVLTSIRRLTNHHVLDRASTSATENVRRTVAAISAATATGSPRG